MHPHVSVQRDLLVRTVRAVRTGVRLLHFEFVGFLLVFFVGGVFLEPGTMSAVKCAMRLEGACRAEADAAWGTDERRRPGWFHGDRLLTIRRKYEQTTRGDCILKSSRKGWHRIRRRGILRFDGERNYSGGSKSRIGRQTRIESQSWCSFVVEFQLFLGRRAIRVRSPRGVLRVSSTRGFSFSNRGRRGGRRSRLTVFFLDHNQVGLDFVRVLWAGFSRLIESRRDMSISQASRNLDIFGETSQSFPSVFGEHAEPQSDVLSGRIRDRNGRGRGIQSRWRR